MLSAGELRVIRPRRVVQLALEWRQGEVAKLDAVREGRRVIVRVLDVTVALREGANGRESGIW